MIVLQILMLIGSVALLVSGAVANRRDKRRKVTSWRGGILAGVGAGLLLATLSWSW